MKERRRRLPIVNPTNALMWKLILILGIAIGGTNLRADDADANGSAAPAPATTENSPLEKLVDGLNQANLQEAYRLLSSEYIQRDRLDHLEINRAALQGLLARLDFGAMLLTESSISATNSPFSYFSCRVNDQIGYTRFGRFTPEELQSLDQTLQDLRENDPVRTLILDLRSPQGQADFAIAAEILSRFRPPNELLFKIRRPGDERPVLFTSRPAASSWSGEIVILVDRETGNVGEIIAAVLQGKNRSLVIGENTSGLTVEYRDVPIGQDRYLRYAIAEVVLESEVSLFRRGVTVDIPAAPSLEAKHEIFRAVDGGRALQDFLFREERPRMNEAALVAGTDPELDYYLAKSSGRPTKWDTTLPEDRALQKAVDILRTRDFLDSGQRRRR